MNPCKQLRQSRVKLRRDYARYLRAHRREVRPTTDPRFATPLTFAQWMKVLVIECRQYQEMQREGTLHFNR